jgi:hypothetical protein
MTSRSKRARAWAQKDSPDESEKESLRPQPLECKKTVIIQIEQWNASKPQLLCPVLRLPTVLVRGAWQKKIPSTDPFRRPLATDFWFG